MMQSTLDLATIRAFLAVAELGSFTRAAQALGTTQAAISMKLQRLETLIQRRLIARTPRLVRLTPDGETFLPRAQDLIAAHDRALGMAEASATPPLRLGISDHAIGAEMPALLARLHALHPGVALTLRLGFSAQLLDEYDRGALDAVIVRREAQRRDGETLVRDEFGWFASAGFIRHDGAPLPLATLAPPCGIRAMALRALDEAHLASTETLMGGGVSAVIAAALSGIAIAPLARRIAPLGLVEIGESLGLPALAPADVVLHARIADAAHAGALRTLAATFRKAVRENRRASSESTAA